MSQERLIRGARYPASLPSESAARRRTPDERLFLRFPAVYRLFADLWMRLPCRSRVRRLLSVRLVGRACAAANRRDFEVLVLGVAHDVEHRPTEGLILDWAPVAYGPDGYLQVWRKMVEAFSEFRAEPKEILDLGDKLLVTTDYKAHGAGSGVPIHETLFQLIRLRRGLVVWQQDFSDRNKALEAAGLQE